MQANIIVKWDGEGKVCVCVDVFNLVCSVVYYISGLIRTAGFGGGYACLTTPSLQLVRLS